MTDNDVRIGLLGAGRMGADHARRLNERISGARLVAVGDPDAERANAAVAEIPGTRTETDPFSVITAADVDAVIIASPGQFHEQLLSTAIERGIPVLCEKPLTPDSESALRILKTEQAAGKQLIQVGFMRRFDSEYRELKRTLDARELGAPLILHCAHRNPSSPPEFDDSMMITDSVVHEIDTTRWLLGDEITRVAVRRARTSTHAPEGLHDPQLVSFETSTGALIDVEIFVNCGFGYQVRCEAVCERGTALAGGDTGPLVHTAGHWGGVITPGFPARFGHAFEDEVQAWVGAARQGRVDGPSAWDGYAAAAVAEAGVRAQQTGAPAAVDMIERPAFYR